MPQESAPENGTATNLRVGVMVKRSGLEDRELWSSGPPCRQLLHRPAALLCSHAPLLPRSYFVVYCEKRSGSKSAFGVSDCSSVMYLDGEPRGRPPHPRLLRVLTEVTGFTPSAVLHRRSCCSLSNSASVKSAPFTAEAGDGAQALARSVRAAPARSVAMRTVCAVQVRESQHGADQNRVRKVRIHEDGAVHERVGQVRARENGGGRDRLRRTTTRSRDARRSDRGRAGARLDQVGAAQISSAQVGAPHLRARKVGQPQVLLGAARRGAPPLGQQAATRCRNGCDARALP